MYIKAEHANEKAVPSYITQECPHFAMGDPTAGISRILMCCFLKATSYTSNGPAEIEQLLKT